MIESFSNNIIISISKFSNFCSKISQRVKKSLFHSNLISCKVMSLNSKFVHFRKYKFHFLEKIGFTLTKN